MKQPIYNIYCCPRCNQMEFTYADKSVHRWCKFHNSKLTGMSKLGGNVHCNGFDTAKPGKAKYLRKHEYFRKYDE